MQVGEPSAGRLDLSVDELRAKLVRRAQQIVSAAQDAQVPHTVGPASTKKLDVVDLEVRPLRAAAPVGPAELAAVPGALKDLLTPRRRNISRARARTPIHIV